MRSVTAERLWKERSAVVIATEEAPEAGVSVRVALLLIEDARAVGAWSFGVRFSQGHRAFAKVPQWGIEVLGSRRVGQG